MATSENVDELEVAVELQGKPKLIDPPASFRYKPVYIVLQYLMNSQNSSLTINISNTSKTVWCQPFRNI
jgi:hypothetical protein